jgi:hypothetical protein
MTQVSFRSAGSDLQAGSREARGVPLRGTPISASVNQRPPALNFVNVKTISDAVVDSNGRIAKAILSGKPDRDLLDELYLASFGRPPSTAELDNGLKYLGSASRGRAALAQDLLWALLNSKPFLYNY